MKIERTNNAIRNVTFGMLYKVLTILFPFIIRTVMLYIMGNDYVGLNSLFTSVLSFLSLAELGVGSALVYSMYKPIAEEDDDMICALLNLYKKLYRIIGIVIATAGILLIPILPNLVKNGCPPDINLYCLYGIYLFNTVISYCMFGYKQSLLVAFQRSDIISKRSMIVQTGMYLFQIVSLFVFRNYYIYIIWLPIFTIMTNLFNAYIVNKMYPKYKCRGSISKETYNSIKKKVFALFGTKTNSVVLHAADNIVISSFLGLGMVGKYGNYYYIMNSIVGIMTIIYDSMTAGLGNSIETESAEKNYNDFMILSFMNSWIVGWFAICLMCIYQPFMKIWVGEKLMFKTNVVILLSAYFYIYQIRKIVLTYKDAAGLWWQDLLRPYVTMLTNIALNIFTVRIIGIYGVILSTVVSMIISVPWENYTVFKYVFNIKSFAYYKKFIKYLSITIFTGALCFTACKYITTGNDFLNLILSILICTFIPNIIFILFYHSSYEFTEFKWRIKKLLFR